MSHSLLIEVGVAELPTAAVDTLSNAFLSAMRAALAQANIPCARAKRYATARRLAVLLQGVANKQGNKTIEKRGPALKAAKDSDGNWTKAALGFAAAFNTKPDALVIKATPKGKWLFYRSVAAGEKTVTIIPKIFAEVMAQLPIAKRMRWGNSEESFIRPVISLAMLWDDAVIDAKLFGITANRQLIGHRFMGEKSLPLDHADNYEKTLADSYVIADIDKRKTSIVGQVKTLASRIDSVPSAKPIIDAAVLNEVNALVEFPVAIFGTFDARYLHIPQEVLIKTMQDNQKYFAIVDGSDNILPYFITIANIQSQNPEAIRIGNQRVIEPRFADAEFFWHKDRQKPLASRREALKKVVYHQQLGSLYERSKRIATISEAIAKKLHYDSKQVVRAAELAKCDLVTDMVFEFGELQGTIGQYYARHDGEAAAVSEAIGEQYLPRFSGDKLPESNTGLILALADKLENIVGSFAIGAKPTGTKDPYALRRATLGIIRLLNETHIDLPIDYLLNTSATSFAPALHTAAHLQDIKAYIDERLKGYYQEQDFRHDHINAVIAASPPSLQDFTARLSALSQFSSIDAKSLLAANKRLRNLLKKTSVEQPAVDTNLFTEVQEGNLFQAVKELQQRLAESLSNHNYAAALNISATLRQPLDDFFDHVMIMADDEAVKQNRLSLLANSQHLLMQVADLSLIDESQTG